MEDKETDPKIPIDKEIDDFHQYVEENDRCILSAKFGDGKTYFLSKFADKFSKDYLIITIHPVNYQIANNYDIFDYIKRDILFNLLMIKDIEIDDTIISKSWMLYSYFRSNHFENLLDLGGFIPDINIGIAKLSTSSFLDNIDKIKEKYEVHKKELRSQQQIGEDYIKEFTSHGIYEFDCISQLICDIIKKYRISQKKKVILIIEDLDRIDPAHIFRVLNIFSAQVDRVNITPEEMIKTHGSNKFNFDKIVTVCDLDNIEKIYHHLYGQDTDFTGYINKFYTDKEFNYSLTDKLSQYIMDNLIDSDLKEYTGVCNKLISCIQKDRNNSASKYNSIRSIIADFKKNGARIRSVKIPIKNTSLYYSSINPLTKLLELLKRFNIKYEDFTDSKIKPELNKLFGVGYLYLYNKYVTQQIYNTISLRISEPNEVALSTGITFDSDGDLITNIDASNLYERKNNITEGINYFKQFIM